jgi:hypothetical protein
VLLTTSDDDNDPGRLQREFLRGTNDTTAAVRVDEDAARWGVPAATDGMVMVVFVSLFGGRWCYYSVWVYWGVAY